MFIGITLLTLTLGILTFVLKKNALSVTTIVIIAGLLLLLQTCDHNQTVTMDKQKDSTINSLNLKADTLKFKLDELIQFRRADSTKNAAFLDTLRNDFKIAKDSLNNKPYKLTNNTSYNTNINTAKEVKIGGN